MVRLPLPSRQTGALFQLYRHTVLRLLQIQGTLHYFLSVQSLSSELLLSFFVLHSMLPYFFCLFVFRRLRFWVNKYRFLYLKGVFRPLSWLTPYHDFMQKLLILKKMEFLGRYLGLLPTCRFKCNMNKVNPLHSVFLVYRCRSFVIPLKTFSAAVLKLSAEMSLDSFSYFSYQVNRCVFNYQSSSTSFRLSSFLCNTRKRL